MTRGVSKPETVAVHIPFRIKKRGGRKEVLLPDGGLLVPKADTAAIKALARAFRWKRMLESGAFLSMKDLAAQEGINPSYLARVLRLTLLAPDIIEAILAGALVRDDDLSVLFRPLPAYWPEQRRALGLEQPVL